jgi:hypothetical protein
MLDVRCGGRKKRRRASCASPTSVCGKGRKRDALLLLYGCPLQVTFSDFHPEQRNSQVIYDIATLSLASAFF